MKNSTQYLLFCIFAFCANYAPAISAGEYYVQKSIHDHQKNTQITAAVPEFFPPFYFVNTDGAPYGMGIEVITEIDHSAGYFTKFTIKKNWTEVFKAIKSGEAQVIPNLGITEERKKKYFFTKPYATTDVTVFTRHDNIIETEKSLQQLRVAFIKNNIGENITKKNNYNSVAYPDIEQAFAALVDKKIDAVIFPQLIGTAAINKLKIKHLVTDTGIILQRLERALAVSKKHPEIFQKLNTSFEKYLSSPDFKDTYVAWYGAQDKPIKNNYLVLINIFVLLGCIYIFYILWERKKITLPQSENKATWIISLIVIFIVATTTVTMFSTWLLYETSFETQKNRLVDTVKSRAKLIESIARYTLKDEKENKHHKVNFKQRTIEQVIDAHQHFSGFGKTGEFTFARKNNNLVEFVLRQRHNFLEKPIPVELNSENAIPMQLALHGHSGTVVARDYRGEKVLAAYEYISILDMGIVAKIDIEEIREPFIHSTLHIITIVILLSFFGSLLYFYIMTPVIRKLYESEQRFHQLFLNNYTPALLVNAKNSRIIDANKAATDFYGYTHDELSSYMLNTLCQNHNAPILEQLHNVINKKNLSVVTQHRLQTGAVKDVEILMSPVEINNETVVHCTVVDISEKLKQQKENEKIQKDLAQARKMEALGQLTGGIAHDFNNMLGIIMGYTELSKEIMSESSNDKISGYLDQVLKASHHAKELISSMMIFSRTDEGSNTPLNIAPLVKEDIKLLRSIIPSSINITHSIDETLPNILIEPVKLQQLIMNLCVNARDAMDAHGTLSISLTYRKNISDNCLICYKQFEGDWVQLTIADTGTGMSDETKAHIFEPFFTTKGKHKGTGMGMAVVHGIIQDLGGHILIDSEPGKGTAFHIFFKPLSKDANTQTEQQVTRKKVQHHERILVVDDEESITEVIAGILSFSGYQCKCFSSSQDALQEFTHHAEDYDLIFSDQTMPNLLGLDMIKAMRKIRPEIPAIIATGYSNSIDDSIAEQFNITLLRKPVEKDKLLEAVNSYFE